MSITIIKNKQWDLNPKSKTACLYRLIKYYFIVFIAFLLDSQRQLKQLGI